MKILMICGYFAPENEAEVIRHARSAVEFSANEFQKKLIRGLRTLDAQVEVLSAPFVGSWPNASDIRVFRGFQDEQSQCRYVPFHNMWGYRNFSRAASLKKAVREFAEDPEENKLILVYCAHTPFLQAAEYAKKLDPRIRVCFYVPDLPNYMNLNADRSRLYDIAKSFDNRKMRHCMACVDSFVLLTEDMADCLPVGDKPRAVLEGILERERLEQPSEPWEDDGIKYIVYTGKMNEKFGIPALVQGFSLLPDPDCRLVLCGSGDCMEEIRAAAAKDSRILIQGQVPPAEAALWQRRAAVLVNPRPDNEAYTKYSFPSKNVEYLLTGKPVAVCMLAGMPEKYRDFIYEIREGTPEQIARTLREALEAPLGEAERKHQTFLAYAREHLTADRIARRIVELTKLS